MAQDALARLLNSNKESSPKYSVEEQMQSVDDDDFLENMSKDSRDALMKSVLPSIQEVTLDDDIDDTTTNSNVVFDSPVDGDVSTEINDLLNSPDDASIEDTKTDDVVFSEPQKQSQEELFINNNEDKKMSRPRGRTKQVSTESTTIKQSGSNGVFDPIMNQLALNVINDIQSKKIRVNGFDDTLMQIIFDYMKSKF